MFGDGSRPVRELRLASISPTPAVPIAHPLVGDIEPPTTPYRPSGWVPMRLGWSDAATGGGDRPRQAWACALISTCSVSALALSPAEPDSCSDTGQPPARTVLRIPRDPLGPATVQNERGQRPRERPSPRCSHMECV